MMGRCWRHMAVAGAALSLVLWMPAPAMADNCGGLKDCYFTAGAALGATLSVIGLGIIAAGFSGLRIRVPQKVAGKPAPVEKLAKDIIEADVAKVGPRPGKR